MTTLPQLVREEDLQYSPAHNDALRYALYFYWKQKCHHCHKWLQGGRGTEIDHLLPKSLGKHPEARKKALDYVGIKEPFSLDAVENLAPIHKDCNGPDGKGSADLSGSGYLVERLAKSKRRAPDVRALAAKLLNSFGLQQAIATVDSYEHFKEHGAGDTYIEWAQVILQTFQDSVPNLFESVIVEKKNLNFSLEEVVSEQDVPTEVGVGLGLTVSDQTTLKLVQSVSGLTIEDVMEKVLRRSMDSARAHVEDAAGSAVDPYSSPGGAIFSRYDIEVDQIFHSGDCLDPIRLSISAEGSAGVDVVYGPEARSVYKEVDIRGKIEVLIRFPSVMGGDVVVEAEVAPGCETAVDGPLRDWDEFFAENA